MKRQKGKLTEYEIERNKKLRKYSDETFQDAIDKLSVYGICNMVRPTGFGKSYNLARITSYKLDNGEYKYNKCLYLYPLNIIKVDVENKYGNNGTSDVKLHNTDFRSYVWLNDRRKDGTLFDELKKYDLIMCDECHLCGSEGFLACYEEFKGLIGVDGIHLIGVTASPNRMDSYDVLENLFGGRRCSVFELTAKKLYEEGIMLEPLWYVGIYDKKEYLRNTVDFITTNYTMKISEKEIERRVKNIEGAEILIKEALREHRPNKKYFKFICFYVDKKDMIEKSDMVKGWFESIYKRMEVHDIFLSSTKFDEEDTITDLGNGKKVSKIEDITKLVEKKDRIDLIHCIDMLNMGYHVDDIDGIIMLRNTRSEIIQTQQVGRCQSVTSDTRPLVFDLVNNYFTKKWFKGDSTARESDFNLDKQFDSDTNDKLIKVLTNDGVEVTMTRGYLAVLKYNDELKKSEHLRRDAKADKMVFWYTKLKAPIYVLAMMYEDMTVDGIVEILEANGVTVEYERDYAESLSAGDKELVAKALQKSKKYKNKPLDAFYLEETRRV